MTRRSLLVEHPRLRQFLGGTATLLAAFASIATSYGYEHEAVCLPDRTVTLTAKQPKYDSRFAVLSNDGKFVLKVSYTATNGDEPQLDVKPIGANASAVSVKSSRYERSEGAPSLLTLDVRVACTDEFPCTAQFEAEVSTDFSPTPEAKGTLHIEVGLIEQEVYQRRPDTYLAIEALE